MSDDKEPNEPFLGYYPAAELVFALVCPVGVEHGKVSNTLINYLRQFGYEAKILRISDLFPTLLPRLGEEWAPPSGPAALANYKMQAGDRVCEITQTRDMLARVAASVIADRRLERLGSKANNDPDGWKMPMPKTAHVISTLKRPSEVNTLRRIYGNGFFLIGISASRETRHRYFDEQGISQQDAISLIETDSAEDSDHGQQTRETFHLADAFLSMESYQAEIPRFLDVVFGCPTITPTAEEHAMFIAYSASLRSGDLSRQVGAAIIDSEGDLLSVGCNEAPKFGGGLYGPEHGNDRDINRKCDSNEAEKLNMIKKILAKLGCANVPLDQALRDLKPTGLLDITEFGRSVHAEMEAILACARTGRQVRGATLYTTTLPCHNCCRHIIAAGIRRVVYIEPYAKSKALPLHSDAISVDEVIEGKLPFQAFNGIGPRRYFDLFSLKLSTGYPIDRKEKGVLKEWHRAEAPPRLQMQPTTYLDREILARESVTDLISKGGRDA